MASHWLVIEMLLNRWDHNQLTSNQQARNLLPGIVLDLGLWTCLRCRGRLSDDCHDGEPRGCVGTRMTETGLDAA
jgi:hypothetical protein